MIHKLFSTLPSFKTLTFEPGLNIVVAEKSPGATQQQTRNAAGKSSIVETVRFLTGGDCDPGTLFRKEPLVNHRFGIKLDISGHAVTIERSGSEPSRTYVEDGTFDGWPVKPTLDEDTGRYTLSVDNLKTDLGHLIFRLREDSGGAWSAKYHPKFRSLLAYFVREEKTGGFRSHVNTVVNAARWHGEVNVSYLLGLDWTIPQQWQTVRDRLDELKKLKKAAEQGVLGDIVGRSGDIHAALVLAQKRVAVLKERIATFNLMPEYRERESETASIARDIARLSDDNMADKHLLKRIEDALHAETPPPLDNLEQVYKDAKVSIPTNVIRRFDEVRAFHESVIRNRRTYLESERAAAAQRIEVRDEQMATLHGRRQTIVALLKSHGALDQLERLHEEIAKEHAQVEVLNEKYDIARKVERGAAELKVEEAELTLRLQQDFQEQEDAVKDAIVAFEEISKELYGKGGTFSPTPSSRGPLFEIQMHAQDSPGIANMQVFCFDMMLMQLCSQRGIGPGFLIHDSHLFDPVDKRQVASALRVGAQMAANTGWQYIVMLNSDQVPAAEDRPAEFDIESHILPVRLSDKTESGGLFGIRFD